MRSRSPLAALLGLRARRLATTRRRVCANCSTSSTGIPSRAWARPARVLFAATRARPAGRELRVPGALEVNRMGERDTSCGSACCAATTRRQRRVRAAASRAYRPADHVRGRDPRARFRHRRPRASSVWALPAYQRPADWVERGLLRVTPRARSRAWPRPALLRSLRLCAAGRRAAHLRTVGVRTRTVSRDFSERIGPETIPLARLERDARARAVARLHLGARADSDRPRPRRLRGRAGSRCPRCRTELAIDEQLCRPGVSATLL